MKYIRGYVYTTEGTDTSLRGLRGEQQPILIHDAEMLNNALCTCVCTNIVGGNVSISSTVLYIDVFALNKHVYSSYLADTVSTLKMISAQLHSYVSLSLQ